MSNNKGIKISRPYWCRQRSLQQCKRYDGEIAKFGTQLPNVFMQTGPNQMQEVGKAYYSSMPLHPYSNTAIR
jgi:hypothetical protein